MFTFGRLRRLVLRPSAVSAAPPSMLPAAECGIGGPPGSPLGEARSFFLGVRSADTPISEEPATELKAPGWDWSCRSWAPSPGTEEADEDEEPGSDFLLDSIINEEIGLSWRKQKKKILYRVKFKYMQIYKWFAIWGFQPRSYLAKVSVFY